MLRQTDGSRELTPRRHERALTSKSTFEPDDEREITVANFYGGGANGGAHFYSVDVSTPAVKFRRVIGQTSPLVQFNNAFDSQLSAIGPEGSFIPPAIADLTATNGSIYFGTDHLDTNSKPKLCRKDSAGIVTVIG